MPRDEKRRQKSLERKAAKRKQKRPSSQVARSSGGGGAGRLPRGVGAWPVLECRASESWRDEGELVQVTVARQSGDGEIAVGVFLVDLGALGIKDAFPALVPSRREYERELLPNVFAMAPSERVDLDTAAKIVREAMVYADGLGFRPHRDYDRAAPILEGANPAASAATVRTGKDGKPFYVAGPHDNPRRILAQLERAVGAGNYDMIVPLEALPEGAEIIDDLEPGDESDGPRGLPAGRRSALPAPGRSGERPGLFRRLFGASNESESG